MTDPDPLTRSHRDLDETFRLPHIYRKLALGFLVGFLAWARIDLYVVWTEPTIPHPIWFGILAVSVPLEMAGMSTWLFAASERSTLTFRNNLVTARGIVGERSFDLGEVDLARWRCVPAPGGSVVLRAGSTRLAIDLSVYGHDERARIVGHLRESLPADVQEGWNLYAYKIAPFEPKPNIAKPGPDEVVVRRDRWNLYMAPGVVAAGLLGGFLWWSTGDPMRFVTSLVVVAMLWLPLRFGTPAEGMVTRKLSGSVDRALTPFLCFAPAWLLVALAGVVAHERYQSGMAYPKATLVVGIIAWFAVLFHEAYRLDRRMVRRDREAADRAAKAQGEPPEAGSPAGFEEF